jgi:hypothetical protein
MTTKAQMRTKIALMLGTSEDAALSTAELDRALEIATAEMSRYVPQMLMEEIHFELDITAETFTSNDDTEVTLNNKPIRKDSEAVTLASDGTKYTRDTDYEMDYINGKIKTLGGGSIDNSVSCKITYQMSKQILNINGLLTSPAKIIAVEWPINEVPVSFCAFEWHGDWLMLRTRGGQSQSSLRDEDEVRIWYTADWDVPGESASGSFSRVYDEIIIQGGAGYALQFEALTQEHASITELGSARTALAAADDDQAAIDVATAAANDAFDVITGELNKIDGSSSEPYDLGLSALALARTELALGNTALDKVTTHIGTEADEELDNGSNRLDAVSSSADKALADAISTPYTDINIALDNAEAELRTATRNADSYLNVGDGLINAVNTGMDPAGENRRYAETQINMANSSIANARTRVDEVQLLISIATERISEANTFVALGNGRISEALGFVREAEGRVSVAQGYANEAEGQISLARVILSKVEMNVAEGTGYLREAETRLAVENRYIAQANGYQANAAQLSNAANLMRIEANERLQSFRDTLESRRLVMNQHAIAATLQHLPAN